MSKENVDFAMEMLPVAREKLRSPVLDTTKYRIFTTPDDDVIKINVSDLKIAIRSRTAKYYPSYANEVTLRTVNKIDGKLVEAPELELWKELGIDIYFYGIATPDKKDYQIYRVIQFYNFHWQITTVGHKLNKYPIYNRRDGTEGIAYDATSFAASPSIYVPDYPIPSPVPMPTTPKPVYPRSYGRRSEPLLWD